MVQPPQTDDTENRNTQRVKRLERFLAIGVGGVFGTLLIGSIIYNSILNFNVGLVPGKATVMGKHVVSGDESDDYMLDYVFEAKGHTIRHSARCSEYSYRRLHEGDAINIEYFSAMPQAASKLDFTKFEFK